MRSILLTAVMALFSLSAAHATTSFTFDGTNSQGNAVNVEGDFAFSNNLLTITLTNLEINPTSVNQNLSGVFFEVFNGGTQLTSGNTTGATTSGATVSDITSTSYTTGTAPGPEVWGLSYGALTGFQLSIFNAATNDYTIIGTPDGSGNYSAANASLTNGHGDPMLFETATFTVNIPGLISTSTVSNVQFAFNTSAGENYTGVPCPDCGGTTQSSTPEPSSILMTGTGAGLLGLLLRRMRRA